MPSVFGWKQVCHSGDPGSRAQVSHAAFVLTIVALGQDFLGVLQFSCQYHSTVSLYSRIVLRAGQWVY
jgi:hypothetical protein